MFGGDKPGISWLFFKHCEQADHHTAMQRNLKKVEAIEVLHCTFLGLETVSVGYKKCWSITKLDIFVHIFQTTVLLLCSYKNTLNN